MKTIAVLFFIFSVLTIVNVYAQKNVVQYDKISMSNSKSLTLETNKGAQNDYSGIYKSYHESRKNITREELHTLDSTIYGEYDWYEVFTPETKYVYQYDAFGFNTSFFSSQFNIPDNEWINGAKLTYNVVADSMEVVCYHWDEELNNWYSVYRDIYLYDANSNLLEYREYYHTTQTEEWILSDYYQKTYNSNNQVIENVYFSRYYGEGPLEYNSKDIFEFDLEFKLIHRVNSYWNHDLGEWYDVSKDDYTYNEANLNDSILVSSYDLNTDFWNYDFSLTIFEYNENNDMILKEVFLRNSMELPYVLYEKYSWGYDYILNTKTEYTYSTDEVEWFCVGKTVHLYDTDDSLLSSTSYYWENLNWQPSYKYEYLYDSYSNNYEINNYGWDWSAMNWKQTSITDFSYNNLYYFEDLAFSRYEDDQEFFTQMLTERVYRSTVEETIKLKEKKMFYWSGIDNQAVEDNQITQFEIFPNPTTDFITVNSGNIETEVEFYIFDLQGRCLQYNVIEGGDNIQISDFSNGMYLYQIVSGNQTFFGKFVKE